MKVQIWLKQRERFVSSRHDDCWFWQKVNKACVRARSRLASGSDRIMAVERSKSGGMWKHVVRCKGFEAESENGSRTV